MVKVWIQEWEESERGWGTRPDGFTAHTKKEDIKKFLDEMRAREKEAYGSMIPDEYSRPCGESFEVELSEELAKTIKDNGTWLPRDWKPTNEVDAARNGGWKTIAKS